jgi:hypothetical protein
MKKKKPSRRGLKGQKTGRGSKACRKLAVRRKQASLGVHVGYTNMFDYLMWTQQVDKAIAKVQGMRLNKAIRNMVQC